MKCSNIKPAEVVSYCPYWISVCDYFQISEILCRYSSIDIFLQTHHFFEDGDNYSVGTFIIRIEGKLYYGIILSQINV